jgi:hypothetical protein
MQTRYRAITVKGVEPEVFIIVGIDFGEQIIRSTSQAMSEAASCAHLREAGASQDEMPASSSRGERILNTAGQH